MFKKGYTPWNKNRKLSDETKNKMSKSAKGKNTWSKGCKLSEETKIKIRNACKGSKCYNWKGGKTIHKQTGYVLIKSNEHPFKNKNSYVFEHRLVMEKHIGRFLTPTERVHHINRNKTDNRIENLMLFSNDSEHQKFHHIK